MRSSICVIDDSITDHLYKILNSLNLPLLTVSKAIPNLAGSEYCTSYVMILNDIKKIEMWQSRFFKPHTRMVVFTSLPLVNVELILMTARKLGNIVIK